MLLQPTDYDALRSEIFEQERELIHSTWDSTQREAMIKRNTFALCDWLLHNYQNLSLAEQDRAISNLSFRCESLDESSRDIIEKKIAAIGLENLFRSKLEEGRKIEQIKPVATESKKTSSGINKKKDVEVKTSFLTLDDGRIAEQIYNPQLKPPHQFVTIADDGFQYSAKIELQGKVYVPAGIELVEKDVVRLPTEPTEYVNDRHLFDEIQNFIHRYLDVPLFYEKLGVLYAKYSWIHDQFSVTSYLRARGDWGSGKTRLTQTVGSISYKPMFCAGSTTSSPIFRIIELFKGTLVLDEADFKNTDLYMDLIKILNQGYTKGSPVLRSEGGSQKWRVEAYDVYGCKIIATRKKYQDQALESRMLNIEIDPTKRKDIPLILNDDFWKEALAIRNKLLYWRFKNYGKVLLNTEHRIEGIENRLNQIIMPILSITADQALIADIKNSVREYQEEMVKDRGLDSEAIILEAIVKLKHLKDQERTFKRIADEANDIAGNSENDKNKLTSKKIGRKNRDSLKLRTERGMDGYYIVWNEKKIKVLVEKYGLNELLEQKDKIADYDDSMASNPEPSF